MEDQLPMMLRQREHKGDGGRRSEGTHVMEEEGYRELFHLQRFYSGKYFPFFISRFSVMEGTSLHLIGNGLSGIINSGIFFVLLFYLSYLGLIFFNAL